MAKNILVRPLISEKSEKMTEDQNQYSFIVNKAANKIEIKKAVESEYNVEVKNVNTLVMPARAKSRNTKSGIVSGRVSSYKKAIVTIADGEEIDFYGEV